MKKSIKISIITLLLLAVVSSADAQFDPYGKDQVKATQHKTHTHKIVKAKTDEGYTKAKMESHTNKSWKGYKKPHPVTKHKTAKHTSKVHTSSKVKKVKSAR